MVQRIFNSVADCLMQLAKKFGLTYNEVNVILYYLLIPLSWCVMLDCRFHRPYCTIGFMVLWSVIPFAKHRHFREWCDTVFYASVNFLNWFNRFGGNYVLNYVIICVLVPLLIYVGLTLLLIL